MRDMNLADILIIVFLIGTILSIIRNTVIMYKKRNTNENTTVNFNRMMFWGMALVYAICLSAFSKIDFNTSIYEKLNARINKPFFLTKEEPEQGYKIEAIIRNETKGLRYVFKFKEALFKP